MRHARKPLTAPALLAPALAVSIGAALMLGACQPQAPGGDPAPAPADAPPVAELPDAFRGDLDLHGTEPFWAVQVRETQITLTRPEPEPNVVGPNPGGVVQDGAAVWESLADGAPFRVTLRERPGCSDGMSDLVYRLEAEVALGELVLKGCGSKASEKPREGGG